MPLTVRLMLHEAEDPWLIEHLAGFRGQDKNRRVMALLRAGYALLNGKISDTPEPKANGTASSESAKDVSKRVEDVDYVKNLGLDPFAFSFGSDREGL